jgi:hypothetical protein
MNLRYESGERSCWFLIFLKMALSFDLRIRLATKISSLLYLTSGWLFLSTLEIGALS